MLSNPVKRRRAAGRNRFIAPLRDAMGDALTQSRAPMRDAVDWRNKAIAPYSSIVRLHGR